MNIIDKWLKKYGSNKVEKNVKLNLRLSYLQLNAFIAKGNDVIFNDEKCEIAFIDKKTGLVDLWNGYEMCWYLGIEPSDITPESV